MQESSNRQARPERDPSGPEPGNADLDPEARDSQGGKSAIRRWVDGFRGHYLSILISLLMALAIYPFVDMESWVAWLLEGWLTVTVLLALWICIGPRYRIPVLILALVAQGLILGDTFHHDSAVGNLLRAAAIFTIAGAILHHVMHDREVTLNAVFGACSVYLLMALAWSKLYLTIESLIPGSFSFSKAGSDAAFEAASIYFSLITMTTIGYGDLVPVSPQARMITALQGVTAQLYVAVVVARIVALEISQRQQNKSS